jgi:putative two-component system response regulator
MSLLEFPPNASAESARQLGIYALARKIELASRRHPGGELPAGLRAAAVLGLVRYAGIADDAGEAHARRVGELSHRVARDLGWAEGHAETLRVAAALHDVGKLGVPAAVLRKPGKLTDDERRVLRMHTWLGYRLFGRAEYPVLRMARVVALGHHERWDGSGYPRGLRDLRIPEAARIVAVADTYDTLVRPRPFRDPIPAPEALDRMDRVHARSFDPDVWAAFLRVREDPPAEVARAG